MMTKENVREIQGNLVKLAKQGEFDVIVQGCNCFHTMGAGLARDIAMNFKDAVRADKATPFGNPDKMGTYSVGVHYVEEKQKYVRILNVYSQYGMGPDEDGTPPVDYDAIEEAFIKLNNEFKWQRVGVPMIGCGLAGGDWGIVKDIINRTLTDVELTIVHFDPEA